MPEDVEGRMKSMIVDRLFMKITPDDIEAEKSLIDDYGVDSVSLLELVVGVEEEFGIAIEDEEFDVKHFETVASLAAFVRSKIDSGEPDNGTS